MSEQSEREGRYADAIRCAVSYLAEETRTEDWLDEARAVMAVADEEQAKLRAGAREQMLRVSLDADAHRHCLVAISASPAPEATTAEGIYWLTEKLAAAEARVRELEAAVQELRDAHQAEVEKIARVEALAERWSTYTDEPAWLTAAGRLRAALSEPATAPGGDHG